MNTASVTQKFIQRPLPWLSLVIGLYGILVLGWNLFPVIYLFWWEIMLAVGAALVRTFFAFDNKPFFQTLLFRLFLLITGGALGGAVIALAIAFSIKGMDLGRSSEGLAGIPLQVGILATGSVLHLIFNYFYNGKFRTAHPMSELMHTFAYMVVLLSLLMVLTMHFIPNYTQLSEAKWVAGAVVLVKFIVDVIWGKYGKLLDDMLSEKSQ